jgi:HK97 family phage portal protein
MRPQASASATSAEAILRELRQGFVSKTGKPVNISTALQVVTVFACLRVIAEGVAQVPFKVFRDRAGGGKDAATSHPLYDVLHRRPNPWQTSFEFRESLIYHAALAGDFFAFKSMVGGQVHALIPLEPGTVTVIKGPDRSLTYKISTNGESRTFPAEAIWHVRGPSWNTWKGMAAVDYAREAIGLSIATEEAHALLHKNGAQASGLYSVEGALSPQQYKDLSDWLKKQITADGKHSPLVLDRGAKWTQISMSGVDAQHLETRKHQVEEVCRAFRVMPIMIGQADKAATYASAEQMFLAHVVHTLCPWYERIEQSADVNLLSKRDREQGIYTKFLPNGLMRGAAKDRSDFYYKMWQMGAYSPNDILRLEDENPYKGGDRRYIPVNYTPTDKEPPE